MKSTRKSAERPCVIVGNSVAGTAAIEAIRLIDRTRPIVVIDRDRCGLYSRPLISYFLEGRADDALLRLRPDGFHARMGVRMILGRTVTAIDPARRSVRLDNGRCIAYGNLLLALGAEPVRPAIDGLDGAGVLTFTTWDDALALKKAVRKGQGTVVIGAGLIGIKAAEGLKSLGSKVAIVELGDRPLPAVLDREAGKIAAARIRKQGVRLLLSKRVRAVRRKNGAVAAAVLDGGEEIPCVCVVVAVGVRPRIGLCRAAKIKTKTGILVDRRMATSVEGVYAAGDVTEAAALAGGRRNIPIWPLAYAQGAVAGAQMAGGNAVCQRGVPMNSIEIFGLPLIALGETAGEERGGEVLVARSKADAAVYKKLVLRDNHIVGALFLGEIERAGIVGGLIRDAVDVGAFKDELLKESLGYIYVPKQYRERHISPLEV